MLASGADPAVVALLPWQTQRAAARAETVQELYGLVERYTGPNGDTLAALDAMEGGPLAIDVADIELAEMEAHMPVGASSTHCFLEASHGTPHQQAELERPVAGQASYLDYHDGREGMDEAAERTAAIHARRRADLERQARTQRGW